MRRLLLIIATAVSCPVVASAQQYAADTWVNLRSTPWKKTGHLIRKLTPEETVTVRQVAPHPGYLPVRTAQGQNGWVSEVHMRDLSVADAEAQTTVIDNSGQPFDAIDRTWTKPPIVPSTIRVQEGNASCGPGGDGGDAETNEHKNRSDTPTESHWVTLDAIRSLPDTAIWRHKPPHDNNRGTWDAGDRALVEPYEGIPLTVVGYFEIVKPQKTSAPTGAKKVGESPNCHSWLEGDTDWHTALVDKPSETEEQSVVVEPTPRTKRPNNGWDPGVVVPLAVRHNAHDTRHESDAVKVRVTGFLMLDPVHVDHIRGGCTKHCGGKTFFRATLWELHPVTRIDVWDGANWVNLDQYKP